MISVVILTYNEECNIGACIASLPWRTDVRVLDSGSTDMTVELAAAAGAKVVARAFTTYAEQRNFALSLEHLQPWIVSLDADERMTPELAAEIEQAIASADSSVAMFRMRRKDMFMGRWLRRSSGYPTWFPRLFRNGRVRVERDVNEIYVADGRTIECQGHILHYPFNKGLDWWFERHNRYSTGEATILASESNAGVPFLSALFSRDPGMRRQSLKRLAYRLPARPFLVFAYLYILRLGFLDGRAGYHYACMRLAYEVMIDAKVAGRAAPPQTTRS